MRYFWISALVLMFSIVNSANANLIVNGDFESVDTSEGLVFDRVLEDLSDPSVYDVYSRYDTYSSLLGWSTLYGYGIEVQATNGAVAEMLKTDADFDANGEFYVELDSEPDYVTSSGTGANSGMVQQLDDLVVGEMYELSFWYLSRTESENDNGVNVLWYDDSTDYQDGVALSVDTTAENFEDWTKYTIQLEATDTSMNIGFGAFGDFWGSHNHPSQDSTYSESSGNGMGGLIDNVSLKVVAVPEPSTIAILGLALFGFANRKRS